MKKKLNQINFYFHLMFYLIKLQDNKTHRTTNGVFIQQLKADAEPKIGAEALKKILAPAPGSVFEVQRAAKKKHAVERRAKKRAAAAKTAELLASTTANMDTEVAESALTSPVPEEPKVTTVSDDEPTEFPGQMDVDAGTTQV